MASHCLLVRCRMARSTVCVLLLQTLLPSLICATAYAQVPAEKPFLSFVRQTAAELRKQDAPPADLAAWQAQRTLLRQQLELAWGGFPQQHAPLEARILETLDRPDYRIEKIVFQTLPGVFMTASAWVPKISGKLPAVLCVHGHWAGAKQDPHVQARCAGLARLGFFVLAVDAFGAGERAIGEQLGEYHGEMTAATLFPIGRPLSGIQVYENGRAVDYLCSRPEVDPQRIGITGASGGGNQSMYAGAWDERFKAVAPVCSVGTYQAYLGAACCMCEVVPGALAMTEESRILALTAPRALLIISATQDAFQFSVGEAAKSISAARPVFSLYNLPDLPRHTVVESPHDYNQPMREAMYGFMTQHLKGQGTGQPIPEPSISLEEPEALRCYPGTTRPDDWLTLPQFAAREARGLLQSRKPLPPSELRQRLERLLGGTEPGAGTGQLTSPAPGTFELQLKPEAGLQLQLVGRNPKSADAGLRLILTGQGSDHPWVREQQRLAEAAGTGWAVLELRATGRMEVSGDRIGKAPDHNSAEWSLWLGRPLCGQWVRDIRLTAALLREKLPCSSIELVASGTGSFAALAAVAIDENIDGADITGLLTSFVSDKPYVGQRLADMVPGILRDAGDVVHVAELVAPRPLRLHAPVTPQGEPLDAAAANELLSRLQPAWQENSERLKLTAGK
ncbi:MAG: alpha/beta hydrolase family protein [Planctomyces sp.]|jgi:dienelactone hydrolase